MKKKLTKAERKQLYLQAIAYIVNDITHQHFVCNVLGRMRGFFESDEDIDDLVNATTLPEFCLFNDNANNYGAWLSYTSFWDLPYGTSQEVINGYKLTVLLLCVEMCK